MRVSAKLRKFVQGFEALRLSAYDDGTGVWTVGWGHTGVDVVPGMTITEAQAKKYFNGDMAVAETAVGMNVDVPLSQSQFDALCSFVYNVGSGAFRSSTLLRKLNAGEHSAVPFEMQRWIHGGGRVMAGLVRRRAEEAAMFTGVFSQSPAPREP